MLSNGISSPVFEKEDVNHDTIKSITFQSNKKVAFVQAHDGDGDTISRIHFMDEQKQELGCYNPYSLTQKGPLLRIQDGEELIGVYGVKDKSNYFTSFGLIVKAWESASGTVE